jgi:thiol-disulfide isomerase/thioredoxin
LEEKTVVLTEIRGLGTEPIHRNRNFIEGTISQTVGQEKFTKILEVLAEKEIAADLSQAVPTGGPFGDYGEIDNVLDEGKTILSHKAGEVLLVDVWATWCGPCQRPMQHNQEMLEKNEAAWGDRVRIVGVSVDEEKETIAARVNSRKWTKIQHLTLLGWKGEHQLIKNFSITGIPFVCLVDKFGKIAYTGHPSSIKLEDKINELLLQETEVIV